MKCNLCTRCPYFNDSTGVTDCSKFKANEEADKVYHDYSDGKLSEMVLQERLREAWAILTVCECGNPAEVMSDQCISCWSDGINEQEFYDDDYQDYEAASFAFGA